MLKRLIVAAMLSTAAVPLPGAAWAYEFCILKQTKDGFVALRAGPSAKARLIARMTPDDEVAILSEEDGVREVHPDWHFVRWWKGSDRLNKGMDGFSGEGYMHRSLIAEDGCG
jgi:hypothetical protein